MLRAEQKQALHTLDWILSPNPIHRGSGRSIILAIALVRSAAANPGSWVPYMDHYPGEHSRLYISQLIHRLIREDPNLSPYFSLSRTQFALYLPVPLENWLPEFCRETEAAELELSEQLSRWELICEDDEII